MNDLQKLSRDLYFDKNLKHNEVSGNDAMRKLFYEKLGLEVGTTGREFQTAWEMNAPKVFQILDEAVDAVVPIIVKNQFDGLAEVRNIALGDVQRFTVKNRELFKVGTVASGTQNLRRQNLKNSNYTIETSAYGVKVYSEFEEFLTGQVDWSDFVNKVAEAFVTFTGQQIYKTMSTSYDGLRASLKVSGTFDFEKLADLARHVRIQSGNERVTVYGTVSALGKIADDLNLSDSMKDQLNKTGYLTTARGLDFYAFPEAGYKEGTEEFLVDSNSFVVIPSSEKIVDVLFEGETYSRENPAELHNAMQIEFVTSKKMGVHVKQASVYGFYKIS